MKKRRWRARHTSATAGAASPSSPSTAQLISGSELMSGSYKQSEQGHEGGQYGSELNPEVNKICISIKNTRRLPYGVPATICLR